MKHDVSHTGFPGSALQFLKQLSSLARPLSLKSKPFSALKLPDDIIISWYSLSDKCQTSAARAVFNAVIHPIPSSKTGCQGMIKEDDRTWLSTQVTQPIQTVNWLTGSSTIISLLPGTRPPHRNTGKCLYLYFFFKNWRVRFFSVYK